MINNYIKIAWRNLWKNKGYSGINIIGLAIGLASALMIVIYIQDERSYDKYHTQVDRIYRVIHTWKDKGKPDRNEVWGIAPIGPALKAAFPEIEKISEFSGQTSLSLRYKDKTFQEDRAFFADSNVFNTFSWKAIAGNLHMALKEPYTAVLTESTARKYFGTENPIGKTLDGGVAAGRAHAGLYKVTAVIADIPHNSHFTFDVLLSMETFKKALPDIFTSWDYVDFYTYVLVDPTFNLEQFNKKTSAFIKQLPTSEVDNYSFHLEPLADAYLNSTADRQPGTTGSLQNLYIFAIIGVFILVIACVNFMNLATSRSMERAKEVGVRKAIGASYRNLVTQFMGESLALVAIAAILSILLVICLLPFMGAFSGKEFTLAALFTPTNIGIFTAIVSITAVLAASYPAFVMASFKPTEVLKGTFKAGLGGKLLRRGLVVFQFGLSIGLIAGTGIVFSQLYHLQHQDLGFQPEKTVVIDFNFDEQVHKNMESLKTIFLNDPDVLAAAAARSMPGTFFPNAGTMIETSNGAMLNYTPALFEVDFDYIPNLGIQIVAGRSYSRDFPADSNHALVINEAAAKLWGYNNPEDIIGKKYAQWGKEGKVIGVVKDFNFLSLHHKIEPLCLRFEPSSSRFFILKLKNSHTANTLTRLEKIWSEKVTNIPFNYSFLDNNFAKQYEADYRFQRIFTTFSGLALFIACLGLLGLITYTAQQRTKEIGIRKVLGASIMGIIQLLALDFMRLVLIAICLATPIAYWAMDMWLHNFAYHIAMQWWIFALAGIGALLIAMVTISFQALKAAKANPVTSLRNE